MITTKVVIPVPDRCLNPNSRSHWGKISDKKRLLRHQSKCSCLSAVNDNVSGIFPLTDADYHIRYYHSTVRFMDEDNILASLKAAIDGAIDAGLIVDDKDVHIKGIERFKDADFQRVEIIFKGDIDPEKEGLGMVCHWDISPDGKTRVTECGKLNVVNRDYAYCPYCSKKIIDWGAE